MVAINYVIYNADTGLIWVNETATDTFYKCKIVASPL